MKKRTVISNVPTRLPIQSTVLYTFLLWHFNVNPIWWGAFITLYVIYWIIALIAKWNEERVDLDKEGLKKEADKSKFAQRLEKLAKDKASKGE